MSLPIPKPQRTDSALSTLSHKSGDELPSSDSDSELSYTPWLTRILEDAAEFEQVLEAEEAQTNKQGLEERDGKTTTPGGDEVSDPTLSAYDGREQRADGQPTGLSVNLRDAASSVTRLVGRDLAELSPTARVATSRIQRLAVADIDWEDDQRRSETDHEESGASVESEAQTLSETRDNVDLDAAPRERAVTSIPASASASESDSRSVSHSPDASMSTTIYEPSAEEKIALFEQDFGVLRKASSLTSEMEVERILMEMDGALWQDVAILVSILFSRVSISC